jgi:hypothetical protein
MSLPFSIDALFETVGDRYRRQPGLARVQQHRVQIGIELGERCAFVERGGLVEAEKCPLALFLLM